MSRRARSPVPRSWTAIRAGLRTVLPLLGLLVAMLPAPLPAAAADSAARPTPRPELLFDTLTPLAPKPTDTLSIGVRIHNPADSPLTRVRVTLVPRRFAVGSRSELHQLRGAERAFPGVAVATEDLAAPVPAHGDSGVALQVPAPNLGFRSPGVYAVQLQMSGRLARNSVFATTTTFLPWFPAPVAPLAITIVVPFVEQPHLVPPTRQLLDRGALTRASDRVERLLGVATVARPAAGRPAPPRASSRAETAPSLRPGFTPAVDPALIEDLSALPANAAGALPQLLDALRSDTGSVQLAYADPDLAALSRAGLGLSAVTAARRSTAAAGGPLVLWPRGGVLPADALDIVAASAPAALLLREGAFPAMQNGTDDALGRVTTSAGSVPVVVSDAELTRLLTSGARVAGDDATVRMAEQLFFAETAMIVAESPQRSQTVAVLPDQLWNPDRLAQSIAADLAAATWLAPTTLPGLLAHAGSAPLRAPLLYPDSAAQQELPGGYLGTVTAIRDSLREFRTVLPADERLTDPFDPALLRLDSALWRGQLAAAQAFHDAVAGNLAALRGAISLATANRVTLSSSRAQLPVTVVNDLPVPVHVAVVVRVPSPSRLRTQPVTVTDVGAKAKHSISVPAQVQGAGYFRVQLQLVTPTAAGSPLDPPLTVLVRSTAYGTVAIAITIGALAVLAAAFVARGVRWLRRRSAQRHPAAAA